MSPVPSKLPTATEVISNTESKSLYRTNLLRLQIEELLSAITPVYEKLSKINTLVKTVSSAITSANPVQIASTVEGQYPEVYAMRALLTPLHFTAPCSVHEVGSFTLQCIVKPLHSVDLGFTIPGSCFSDKDFKSHRYFDRRKVYCAELCKQLKDVLKDYSVELRWWQGDQQKPFIVVSVPGSTWSINLIPCVSPTQFPFSKLTPEYKNVAESTVCDPLYNASILEDMHISDDSFASPKVLNFGRAVQLVKVWLYRRRLLITSTNIVGLSGYQIRALLTHICKTQSLPREVSVYQLFKLFIAFLSKTDWIKQSIVIGTANPVNRDLLLPYPVLQSSNGYNILWRVPLCVMEELSAEATDSIATLDDMSVMDPFESLFCPTTRPNDFNISIKSQGTDIRTIIDTLSRDIKLGLGNRLFRNSIRARATDGLITVSGDIDASTAMILIDKGPSADSAEAASFRSFWSTKAELRRFRDGSILECTVWDKASPVAEQIIRHVLSSRFGSLDSTLSVCPLGACNAVNSNHIELWSSFESLRSKLVSVENLPISIVDFRPSHARFTMSDLISGSGTLQPLDCVIEFESSKNWPNSRLAIWHSKVAFLLAIKTGLGTNASVQIAAEDENEEPFVDVKIAGSKYVFRVRIFASIELQTINAQLASVDNPPSAMDILRVSSIYFEPMLRRRMHALSSECPAVTGASRRAKEWLDNHLLIEPWLDNFVELTIAYVALSSPDARRAQTPHTLFLSWLFFIANHPYKTNPLFMRWSEEENHELRERFDAAVDGRRSWWISSDIDQDCLFVRRPDEWESDRIQKLAKDALVFADKAQWDLIQFGTDNGSVYDVLMEIADGVDMDILVKLLGEQFRKYFSFYYSQRHRLMGIVFETALFRPQSNTSLKGASMMAVVEETAVPDFAALISKMSVLVGDSVTSIKVRR
jgi:U3 small nucleolar RNA-associated protein 22